MTLPHQLHLKEINQQDEKRFIQTMKKSHDFHQPFTTSPQTKEAFHTHFLRSQQDNQRCYLILNQENHIVGVFNINEIVRGFFQSGYLGYYASVDFAGKGLMSLGLKLVLKEIFTELKLHRIEANIQPNNTPSIQLVTRNGFIKEGFSPRYLKINNIWCDHIRYALTYEDWVNTQ
ncbi:hypothetical protein TUM19329_29330 [Legionella antarctica]|uniref:N-acetyltransferase domain-containing protein n=1 Tax=Legionella antarctica TaxID=2708020 RepID=A0A6F8T943_9GAMM|nr:GNAT family N-acetyltransferase [Legionella antarctica]BCA96572.1 hypothetical protein TUM19329_29330 [Legionella antarctica]